MKKNGEYDPPRLGSLKKICRIMKATMLFLMLTVCHSFGMVHAQEVRLDIDLEKANFAEFMEQVKKQTEFTFFFHDAMVMSLKDITLHMRQALRYKYIFLLLCPRPRSFCLKYPVCFLRPRSQK